MRTLLERYGWPKGPVNAIELWNEPWEGISISGWGADMPRYRELYTRMAQGVEEARKNAGVQVLVGGRVLVDEHRRQAVFRRPRRAVSQMARLHQHSLPADVPRAGADQTFRRAQEPQRADARVGHRKLDGQ